MGRSWMGRRNRRGDVAWSAADRRAEERDDTDLTEAETEAARYGRGRIVPSDRDDVDRLPDELVYRVTP